MLPPLKAVWGRQRLLSRFAHSLVRLLKGLRLGCIGRNMSWQAVKQKLMLLLLLLIL